MYNSTEGSVSVKLTPEREIEQRTDGDYVKFSGRVCLSDILGPSVDDGSDRGIILAHRIGRVTGRVDKYPDMGYFTVTGDRGQSVVAGVHYSKHDKIQQGLHCGITHEWLPELPIVQQRDLLVKAAKMYVGSKLQAEFRALLSEYNELKRKGSITCTWAGTGEVSNICHVSCPAGGLVHFNNMSRKPYPSNVTDMQGPSSMLVKFVTGLRALYVSGARRTWVGYLSQLTHVTDKRALVDRNLVGQVFQHRFGTGLGQYFDGTETDTSGIRSYTQFVSTAALDAICEAFRPLEAVSNTFLVDVSEPLDVRVYVRKELIKIKSAQEMRFEMSAVVESFPITRHRGLQDYPNLHRRYSEVLSGALEASAMDGVEIDVAALEAKEEATKKESKKEEPKPEAEEEDGKEGWDIPLESVESLPIRKACMFYPYAAGCTGQRNSFDAVLQALGTETFIKKHKQKINVYAPAQQGVGRNLSQIELIQRQLDLFKETSQTPHQLLHLQRQLDQLRR
ncbi:protein ORF60 [Cyprinid herpesvirus 1]|uniref:Protein ORF60 n=1 Tax=Cyprinid herpesvirus 1 TaxID=317858 RepID=K7PBC9_9VIRU|nr:protein ORF60 [Cyprinid herpesvirus 1]AFJ20359.1 protein ORF60 [Cyprinid herpesvirus 1]